MHDSVFMSIMCGHCINDNLTRKQKSNLPLSAGCEFWEFNETKKADRKQTIKCVISNMEKHLNEIKQILMFDSE